MKTNKLLLPIMLLALGFASCNSKKNIPYIKDTDSITNEEYTNQLVVKYQAVIMPNDLITILVHTTEPSSSAIFNPSSNPGAKNSNALYKYLVDINGNIQFPLLGEIYVKGATVREVEQRIKSGLKKYITEESLVTVQFADYQISVLGEVKQAGSYKIDDEKVNVFEALAMAGDMTIYGKRDNVKIMREEADGKKRVITLNLNDKDVIYSPNFYLQQNDVLYVEPNRARAQSADIGPAMTLGLSSVGVLISVVNLVLNLSTK